MVNRPWKDQHRSWIMFMDDIKKNPDIISGEVEGNIYLLDCETARLSIWLEKWETFTDVGVSRLIRQERISMEGHVAPREKGAHIFYKGIELQKTYVERDSELIEFIDIKKELSRNLINLSRGGFTKEGEKFLRLELYPGLIEAIQCVLHDLEKQGKIDENGEIKFQVSEVILKNIVKKCDFIAEKLNHQEEDSEELIECENDLIVLVVSSAVLAYFAIREQWSIYSKMLGYNASRGDFWLQFLDRIDEILRQEKYEKVMLRLSELTSFFNLKVYDENGDPYNKRGARNEGRDIYWFLNIFQKNNHWAVLQVRKNQMSSWTSHLIFFPEEHRLKGNESEKGISVGEVYRQITEIPHEKENDVALEEWSRLLLSESTQQSLEKNHTGAGMNYTGGQQFVLNWILKNVPTIALLCDETGNIRLNVLSSKINPSIYMNQNFKFLVVNRLLEKAQKENNKRFATIAWQGTEYLTCRDLSKYVLFVKRGYFSEYSYQEVAVPYDKTILQTWGQEIKKGTLKEVIFPQIKRLLKDMDIMSYVENYLEHTTDNEEDFEIKDFLLSEETDISQEVGLDLIDMIGVGLNQEKYQLHTPFIELLEAKEERTCEWNRIYSAVLKNYVAQRKMEEQPDTGNSGKEIKPIIDNPFFQSLCDAWYYFLVYGESVLVENGLSKIQYNQNTAKADPREERMIQYIKEKGYFHVDEADIRKSLNRFKKEIFGMIQELELRDIQKEIHGFLKKYEYRSNSIKLGRNSASEPKEYDS